MERLRHRRAVRWLWATLLLLLALCGLMHYPTGADAQRMERVDHGIQVVGGEQVAAALDDPTLDATTTTTKTVAFDTHTRVATTIETTRIAGGDVGEQRVGEALPASVAALEQCRARSGSDAQCAEDPADAMPIPSDQADEDRTSNKQPVDMATAQQLAVLEIAARHLKELQDHVDILLPKLQTAVASVLDEIQQMWVSLQGKWNALYSQCAILYDHFLSDAVEALKVVYHRVAAVTIDVYDVVRSYVAVVAGEARTLWNTHEEVRVVTRHVVSVGLLALLGAVFCSVYALAATVPDTVSAMWSSLDDLTRAQLKIVCVLVSVFAIYHLRALWSFWLLVGSIVTFYYWSGHVLAKRLPPRVPSSRALQRQASSFREKPKMQ